MTIPGYLTSRQVSERLGLTRRRVQQLAPALGATQAGRDWLFPAEAVERYRPPPPEKGGRPRLIPPDQIIANVEASLVQLRARPRRRGRQQAINEAARHLAELRARHAAGALAPLEDDGEPF